jgi:hypothetical protein
VDYALNKRVRDAFADRDMGPPVFSGTQFVRVGLYTHQHRMVELDVIIRGFISEPTIEYYSDQSIRYHIDPKAELILGVVRHTRLLRAYCMSSMDNRWLYLLTPLCQKCLRPHTEHPGDKCLFEPTKWTEHMFSGDDRLLQGTVT